MNLSKLIKVFGRLKVSDNAASCFHKSSQRRYQPICSFILQICLFLPIFQLRCQPRSSTRPFHISNCYQAILDEIGKNFPDNIACHWDGKVTEDCLGEKQEVLCVTVAFAPRFVGCTVKFSAFKRSQMQVVKNK